MSEIIEKLEDIGKRLNLEISRCKQCGGIPSIITRYDDLSRDVDIVCECGLKIPVGYTRLDQTIEMWNNMNRTDMFTPREKPHWVGKPRVCASCVQRRICVEARKISNLYEFACYDWVEEIVKEC